MSTKVERIFVESKPVTISGASHLYLVKRLVEVGSDGSIVNAYTAAERAIRGGPESVPEFAPLTVEVDKLVNTGDAYADGVSPAARFSVDITDLVISKGQHSEVESAWMAMEHFAVGLSGSYAYRLPSPASGEFGIANSNALILSVLNSVGVDISQIRSPTPDGSPYVDSVGIAKYGHPGADSGTPTLLGSGADGALIAAADGTSRGLYLLGRDGWEDHFIGTAHADTVQGAQFMVNDHSVDTMDYGRSEAGVNLQAVRDIRGSYIAGKGGDAEGDELWGVERFIGSAHGDVVRLSDDVTARMLPDNWVAGMAGDDSLNGGAGDDILLGGSGHDTLVAGGGADILLGGIGVDTIYFDSSDYVVKGGAGDDHLHLVDTGSGWIPASGGSGRDTLHLGSGDTFDFDFDPSGNLVVGAGNVRITSVESIVVGDAEHSEGAGPKFWSSDFDGATEDLLTDVAMGGGGTFRGERLNQDWHEVHVATVRENADQGARLIFQATVDSGIPDDAVATLLGLSGDLSHTYVDRVLSIYRSDVDAEVSRIMDATVQFDWTERFEDGSEWGRSALARATSFVLNVADNSPTTITAFDKVWGMGGHSLSTGLDISVDRFDVDTDFDMWLSTDGDGQFMLDERNTLLSVRPIDFRGEESIKLTLTGTDGSVTLHHDLWVHDAMCAWG